jgi:hypothetical protein
MLRSPLLQYPTPMPLLQCPTAMLCLSIWESAFLSSLKALLANLLGKERGHQNENARKLLYFVSLGILAEFSIYQSIFRFFLDSKLILQYYF